MTEPLSEKPSLEFLKKKAKETVRAHREGDAAVCSVLRKLRRFRESSDEDILSQDLSLRDVQFAIAMQYGFESWMKLRKHILSVQSGEDRGREEARKLFLGLLGEAAQPAGAVVGTVSRRLVRCVCPSCRESYEPEPHVLDSFPELKGATLYRGTGCDECVQTGYRGRTVIHEVLPMTEEMKAALPDLAGLSETGVPTVRDDGIAKVAEGLTTVEEVLRVT